MWQIVGLKHISYNRKDGSHVDGYEVHLVGDSTDDNFEGQQTFKLFCSPSRPPLIGDIVNLRISFFGGQPKVSGIDFLN